MRGNKYPLYYIFFWVGRGFSEVPCYGNSSDSSGSEVRTFGGYPAGFSLIPASVERGWDYEDFLNRSSF